jgi:surface-anchored protein
MLKRIASITLAALAAAMSGCGGNNDVPPPDGGAANQPADGGAPSQPADGGAANFECIEGRDGWAQCVDNKIQWCHATGSPHFHWGTQCAALQLECVETSDRTAVCVDPSKPCTAGTHRCENNTAYNCVDGKTSIEPCGTAKQCRDEASSALCDDKAEVCNGHGNLRGDACDCDEGYSRDPADKTKCVANTDFPTESCNLFAQAAAALAPATTFEQFDLAHAELNKVFEVDLPANSVAYVHFEAPAAGEYVVFLGTTDTFDALLDPSGKIIPTAGGVPNEKCASSIADHYHAEVNPGPSEPAVIIRFKEGAARKVKVLVRPKPGADICSPLPTPGQASIALSVGHVDLLAMSYDCKGGGSVSVAALDESLGLGDAVLRDVRNVLIHATVDATMLTLPEGFGFLGPEGAPVYIFPEVFDERMVWPGWDSNGVPLGVFNDDALTLVLNSVEGPNAFVGYVMSDEPVILFDRKNGIDRTIVRAGTHTHMNWAFTSPGLYKLHFTIEGTRNGSKTTTNALVRFFIGDLEDLPETEPTVVAVKGLGVAYSIGDKLSLQAVRHGAEVAFETRWLQQCPVDAQGGNFNVKPWSEVGRGDTLEHILVERDRACQYRAALFNEIGAEYATSQSVMPAVQ